MKKRVMLFTDSLVFGVQGVAQHIWKWLSIDIMQFFAFGFLLVLDFCISIILFPGITLTSFISGYAKFFSTVVHSIKVSQWGYLWKLAKIFIAYNVHTITGVFVLCALASIVYIRMALDIYDVNRTTIGRFFSSIYLVPKVMVASVLYWLVGIIGLFLGVIPGIIWFIKASFFSYVIVDTHASVIASFKKSFQLTKGYVGQLFCLALLYRGAFYSLAQSWVGLIIILVFSASAVLSRAYFYRKLQENNTPVV